jgi:hypothetical protein
LAPIQALVANLSMAAVLLTVSRVASPLVVDWRYGKQLADQNRIHSDDLSANSNAAAALVRPVQAKMRNK